MEEISADTRHGSLELSFPRSRVSYDAQAAEIVRRLAEASTTGSPLGVFSVSIYDTAWVSMISKERGGNRHWLFPESFLMILETQSRLGGWEHGVSDVDGIMNSMAALLAIRWHQKHPSYQDCPALPIDLDQRVSEAVDWLDTALKKWDIEDSDQVGFEVLVPSLLLLLKQENITFQFPASRRLTLLNAAKLSKFDPYILYTGEKSTLLHSLEAFIGIIDFDRVCHHTVEGSMMASPSSTAAYLIYASRWDDDAEAYLHRACEHGAGLGTGGFPSAYPTTIFETSWVSLKRNGSGQADCSVGSINIASSRFHGGFFRCISHPATRSAFRDKPCRERRDSWLW